MGATENAIALRVAHPAHPAPLALEMTRDTVDLIKQTVCPAGIPDADFLLFIEQCKRSGLDPLIKQAFCVKRRVNIGTRNQDNWVTKYEFQPSEAGFLARAETFPDYRGTTASEVYEEDFCEIDASRGEVEHKYRPTKNRGRLLGAWARVERAGRTPVVVWLDYDAYADTNQMWKSKGPTMIAKCARIAALRKVYPSQFGGLYLAEEMRDDDHGASESAQLEAPAAPQRPATAGQKLLGRLEKNAPQVAAAITAFAPLAPAPASVADAPEDLGVVVGEVEVLAAQAPLTFLPDDPSDNEARELLGVLDGEEVADEPEPDAIEPPASAAAPERTSISEDEANALAGRIREVYGRGAMNVVDRLLAKYGRGDLTELAPSECAEALKLVEEKAAEFAARKKP